MCKQSLPKALTREVRKVTERSTPHDGEAGIPRGRRPTRDFGCRRRPIGAKKVYNGLYLLAPTATEGVFYKILILLINLVGAQGLEPWTR